MYSMGNKNRIAIAITGASGSIYAKIFLDKLVELKDQIDKVGIVMSDNAKYVWKHELGNEDYKNYPFDFYGKNDFTAPFASGSAQYNIMVILPCSMGTIGRIANGISNDLTTRAADVVLKERRKLVLVARETPFNLIHLKNMTSITEAGGIICPAIPSFYSTPKSIEEAVETVINRVVDLIGLQQDSYRWGKD